MTDLVGGMWLFGVAVGRSSPDLQSLFPHRRQHVGHFVHHTVTVIITVIIVATTA